MCGIAGIVLSIGAAVVAYISCEAAERLKLADSAKLFALTFLLVTFGAHDPTSMLCCAVLMLCTSCYAMLTELCHSLHLAFGVQCDLSWQLCWTLANLEGLQWLVRLHMCFACTRAACGTMLVPAMFHRRRCQFVDSSLCSSKLHCMPGVHGAMQVPCRCASAGSAASALVCLCLFCFPSLCTPAVPA